MMETIFAWFGAITIMLFLIWLIVWTISVTRKNLVRRHTKQIKEKLKLYEELADDINAQIKILIDDDWSGYYKRGYTFEKLCKEIIKLREFKKEHENEEVVE